MSDGEFSQALQAGELSDLVFVRPHVELSSSSLLEEAVLEDTKATLSVRSGSKVLKDPFDPFYPLVRISRTWCATSHRLSYLRIELSVMKLPYFLELNTA